MVAIAASGVAGLIGWWIYRTQLRDRPGVIAPMLLCVALIAALPTLVRPMYPGATIAALGGVCGTLLGYAIWRWLVKRDEAMA